jgi:hypothetical protein
MQSSKELRSINQIIGFTSNEATGGSSHLINRVEELCNLPISELQIEDYRMLINQGIALTYTVPAAIDILSSNLFAEGDYFEGDLLKSVLTIDDSFWKENLTLKDKLKQICLSEFNGIESLDLSESIKESLHALVKDFLSLK